MMNGVKGIWQEAKMTAHDFNKQFDPREYYRCIRKMGFQREQAKTMTRYYHRVVYETIQIMYDLGYHCEKDKGQE